MNELSSPVVFMSPSVDIPTVVPAACKKSKDMFSVLLVGAEPREGNIFPKALDSLTYNGGIWGRANSRGLTKTDGSVPLLRALARSWNTSGVC